ncbi:TPR repeat-containing thioredoxin TTL1-like [Tasmannia lanceolata]|uniref:TPR repeat-containing thioredoxin TTL1-like n=1 Tax=Tasmannia lanceolata TaxID=3420 RepID=UPI004062E728
MESYEDEKKSTGCGIMILYNGVFRRRSFWPRRTASTSSLRSTNGSKGSLKLSNSNSKRRRGGSDETAFWETPNLSDSLPKLAEKPIFKTTLNSKNFNSPHQNIGRKSCDTNSNTSSRTSNKMVVPATRAVQQQKNITISGELDSFIPDYRSKGNGALVRASSSNMMVFGHLGNIRQSGNGNFSNSPSNNVLDYLPKTAREMATAEIGKGRNQNRNGVMGNIVVTKGNEKENISKEPQAVLCRALSRRLDPEELKVMGNEEYKHGRFAEALALYDRAIALDPERASYRSNKSAALTGLGRLLEAVDECREAIKIEPSYSRAHYRLGNLYLRLGEAEKALNHYKQSGNEADSKDFSQAQALQTHLAKCNDARKLRDWHTMLKHAGCAISSGADSASQVFASQAEAMLKLHRHQEADKTLSCAPSFDIDSSTKFFGAVCSAYVFLIRAQVDMAAGRFEEAVAAAQRAARLDSNNKEAGTVMRRARAVAAARSNGNDLFKASKFGEACVAYGEGLEHDPHNAVLLCNRAASRSKLGQWEKAIEDCTSALNVRPSYSKARLRRADCNAKLERWEASLQDYEALIRESPGNEEVGRALFEAQVQLKKRRGEDVKDMKFGPDLVVVNSNDRFRHIVTSPGMSVVLFCNKSRDISKQILPFTEQLCKRYPSVNFLKVDVEDNPYLAKSEGVSSVPAFKIYKNGSRVKDIDGSNQELLESSVKFFST